MFRGIFGGAFDLNGDGTMDSFERRAENNAALEEIRQLEGIGTPLSEMSQEELSDLAAFSGIDFDDDGF